MNDTNNLDPMQQPFGVSYIARQPLPGEARHLTDAQLIQAVHDVADTLERRAPTTAAALREAARRLGLPLMNSRTMSLLEREEVRQEAQQAMRLGL